MISVVLFGLGTAHAVASGQSFTCTPTHFWDGNGPIWCAKGAKVGLGGIAAREMDGSSKRGHTWPDTRATAAHEGLAKLLGRVNWTVPTGHLLAKRARLQCVAEGGAGGEHTAAWCSSPVHGDISCAMVKAELAVRWAKYWRAHRCA